MPSILKQALPEALVMLETNREVLIPSRAGVMVIRKFKTSYILRKARPADILKLPVTEGVGAAFPSLSPAFVMEASRRDAIHSRLALGDTSLASGDSGDDSC